jgi:hypothetical protein
MRLCSVPLAWQTMLWVGCGRCGGSDIHKRQERRFVAGCGVRRVYPPMRDIVGMWMQIPWRSKHRMCDLCWKLNYTTNTDCGSATLSSFLLSLCEPRSSSTFPRPPHLHLPYHHPIHHSRTVPYTGSGMSVHPNRILNKVNLDACLYKSFVSTALPSHPQGQLKIEGNQNQITLTQTPPSLMVVVRPKLTMRRVALVNAVYGK